MEADKVKDLEEKTAVSKLKILEKVYELIQES
jgi:hypothetical protein